MLFLIGAFFLLAAAGTQTASAATLTYHDRHFLYTITSSPSWQGTTTGYEYEGFPIDLPAGAFTGTGALPPGVTRVATGGWDRAVIAAAIQSKIAATHDREAGMVTISKNASGAILFDGIGMPGQKVDIEAAVDLTIAALEGGADRITLPLIHTPPTVTVTDPELREMGIKELVTVGESDFDHSPANRIHNIGVGLARFNGHLIPKDSVFSFVETLGPVNASTGYRQELVIKGDKTVPDYGGGLCQISSTAYRGIWEYGFPVLQRKNHSYSVSHYFPQGTDATIYPPNVDMKFKNDSPGALLIQTHQQNEEAYFFFYGTKDERRAEVVGPFTWGRTDPPPDRTELTTDLAPGEKKKVGSAVPGIKAMWFRIVQKPGEEQKIESVFSHYEARPNYTQIGVSAIDLPAAGSGGQLGSEMPTWFGGD